MKRVAKNESEKFVKELKNKMWDCRESESKK